MIDVLAGAALAAGGGLFYAWRVEPRWTRFRTRTLPLGTRLPGGKPLSILHLSDLHFDAGEDWKLKKLAPLLREEYDFAFVTGDHIERDAGIAPAAELVRAIRARLGVYCVLGNHDVYRYQLYDLFSAFPRPIPRRILHNDTEGLRRALEAAGARVLVNETEEVKVRGEPVTLAGLHDPHTHFHDLDAVARAMPPREERRLRILLAHAPDPLYWARDQGFDLFLCGHTHGGQICIPGWGPLSIRTDIPKRYATGSHRLGGLHLHVSPGFGAIKSVPLRFWSRPEATVLRLEA